MSVTTSSFGISSVDPQYHEILKGPILLRQGFIRKIDSRIFFSVSAVIKCLYPTLICPSGTLNPKLAHRWAKGVPRARDSLPSKTNSISVDTFRRANLVHKYIYLLFNF